MFIIRPDAGNVSATIKSCENHIVKTEPALSLSWGDKLRNKGRIQTGGTGSDLDTETSSDSEAQETVSVRAACWVARTPPRCSAAGLGELCSFPNQQCDIHTRLMPRRRLLSVCLNGKNQAKPFEGCWTGLKQLCVPIIVLTLTSDLMVKTNKKLFLKGNILVFIISTEVQMLFVWAQSSKSNPPVSFPSCLLSHLSLSSLDHKSQINEDVTVPFSLIGSSK